MYIWYRMVVETERRLTMARAIAWFFIFLTVALGLAAWYGYLTPSQEKQSYLIVNVEDQEKLALVALDCSDGMNSPELSQLLCAIAAYNISHREDLGKRRNLTVVFTKLLEYVPEPLEETVVQMSFVREESGLMLFNGLGVLKKHPNYHRAFMLAGRFATATSVADLLPPGYKHLACVDKVVFARQRLFGILGRRLNVKEDDFPKFHEQSEREVVYTDKDGARFYCLKKKT